MTKEQTQKTEKMQAETVKFLSLGGEEDVTCNMYLYEYKDQILIVDCGLGFPDETMVGVDLLLPDITYLLQNSMPEGKAKKNIVGMLLTHGHEDHKQSQFILISRPERSKEQCTFVRMGNLRKMGCRSQHRTCF